MAMLISFKILFQLSLLLHQFPSLHSSAYTPPNKYFINCGADSDTTFGHGRLFIGDLKPGSFPINPGKSEHVRGTNFSGDIPELYHTARVYTHPAWYEFAVDQDGMYLVRLHFSSFLFSGSEISKARFNIYLPGYTLLYNFTTQNSSKTPLIEEFLLDVKQGRFGIYFEPFTNSSFAFVNAIEIFLAPDYLIPAEIEAGNSFTDNYTRSNQTFSLVSKAVKPIYRINVGGSPITPENDTLWRIWVPDDAFLANPKAAENRAEFQGNIGYGSNLTEYVAPDNVYRTAKLIKANSGGQQNFSSVAWLLKVRKKTSYFARVHFCDVVSNTAGSLQFNFFIYTTLIATVDPYNITNEFAVPFLYDLSVVSDDSGFLNISIGLNNESNTKSGFLNGIEIFELINKSDSGPVWKEEKKRSQVLRNCLIGVAVFAFMATLIGFIFVYSKGKKTKFNQALQAPFYGGGRSHTSDKNSISALDPDINISLRIPFEEIKAATQNFDEKLVIGAGGFGKVYVGNYRGIKVAVKRSQPELRQGISEFQTEVVVLSQIKHRHLVSFIGYCEENSEMILVYEFMENGTLRDHLYSSKADSGKPVSRSELSWSQRLKICIDAAKGLDYLHSETAGGFIHRDVKTTNILLDKENVAKVGDFGLSKSALPDADELAGGLMGSFGYLDPEYCSMGHVSTKSDVYAFGVVLLEVVSARPPIWTSVSGEKKTLAEFAKRRHGRGEVEKMTDSSLMGTINQDSLRIFLQTAMNCLKETGAERPRMHEVVYDLQYALTRQQVPAPREPFDDSIVSGALEFSSPIVHGSANFSFLEEDESNNNGVKDLWLHELLLD